jgi:hypothetical protein
MYIFYWLTLYTKQFGIKIIVLYSKLILYQIKTSRTKGSLYPKLTVFKFFQNFIINFAKFLI